MMTLTTALRDIADRLTAAGVPADIDPARVEVPGALVIADRLKSITLDGTMQLRVQLHLVARDEPTPDALDELERLLGATLSVVEPDGDIELDGFVKTPAGNLPAWTIPIHLYT